LKKERKRKRWRAGAIGCLSGMLIGGPVGAILIGAGAAVVSNRRNRKKEIQMLEEYRMKVKQQASVAITLESCTVYKDN
jgi:gas vesicle protein